MEHLYDTHFHLDLQKDRLSAIREIEDNHVYTIAVTNLPDLYRKEMAEISSKYIRIALGFHPELVHEYSIQIPLMWDLLPKARYIGEVGLDFTDKTYIGDQEAFFCELVDRCRYDGKKIMTIHSRRAVGRVLDTIGDDFRFKPILHWFTGTKAELFRAIDAGFWFSVNSAMIKSGRSRDLLSLLPKDRILLETDSPFIRHDNYARDLESVKLSFCSVFGFVDFWHNLKCLLESVN